MTDTPDASPEKPKKKIITVGEDRIKSDAGNERGGAERGGGDRRGGKGRRGGRDRDEGDRRPATPPALMRGPKPKPKAVVEEVVEEATEEAANDAIAGEADSEGTPAPEAVAETSEPEAEGSPT
jgi:hypothetical protein